MHSHAIISTRHGKLRALTAFTWRGTGFYDALSDGSARLWPPLTFAGEALLKRREELFKEQSGGRSG
jgi:hypothetical protein